MRFPLFSAKTGLIFVVLNLAFGFICWQWLFSQPLAIAVHTWPGYEPLFLAQREGWLRSDRAQLLETQSATESMQALLSGEVDGAALTLDEVLKLRNKGLPVTVILVFDMSAGADMLVARADITQLSDLKGKRIGYEASAVGALMLSEMLKTAALSLEDIQPVSISIDQQVQAWLDQRVEALITYEPTASLLMAQGGSKLFDSGQIPDTIVDVLALRIDKLDIFHAASLRHLLAAHFKALAHFHHNPQDAIYRMAAHLRLPASDVLSAFKGLVLPDATENYRLLQGPSAQVRQNAEKLVNIMLQSQLLDAKDSLHDLINADYLPSDL